MELLFLRACKKKGSNFRKFDWDEHWAIESVNFFEEDTLVVCEDLGENDDEFLNNLLRRLV